MSKMYIRISDDNPSESQEYGRLSEGSLPPGIRAIDSAELAEKMKELSLQLGEVFGEVETMGKLKLNRVELGIEINGEAGINLIASGKVGGKGSIKLVFEPS